MCVVISSWFLLGRMGFTREDWIIVQLILKFVRRLVVIVVTALVLALRVVVRSVCGTVVVRVCRLADRQMPWSECVRLLVLCVARIFMTLMLRLRLTVTEWTRASRRQLPLLKKVLRGWANRSSPKIMASTFLKRLGWVVFLNLAFSMLGPTAISGGWWHMLVMVGAQMALMFKPLYSLRLVRRAWGQWLRLLLVLNRTGPMKTAMAILLLCLWVVWTSDVRFLRRVFTATIML